MCKNILSSIFANLLILTFIAACGSTNPASNHTLRSTPVTKSVLTHVPPTHMSVTPTSEPAEGYLSSDNRHLLWIQWNENSPGNIQGIWHVAYYNLPSKTVKDFNAPFTGTLNGESININIHYSQFISVTASGSLKGNKLHIMINKGGKIIDAYRTSQVAYKKFLQQFQIEHT
jgi:hypothetical protein